MTRLAGIRDPQQPAMTAPPQRARKTQERSLMGLLADPRVRLAVGAAATLITARLARQDRVGYCEAQAFQAINGLPGSLYGPVWVIMQLGTLGAAPAAAGAALLAHDRELAGLLLAGGAGTWALSKLVKHIVRRPRPAALVSGTHTRGRDASGLGYPSGHAGVAVALGTAAFPGLSPPGRAVVAAAVPIVGLSRIYVGAHLPLDIAGGAALGLVVGAAWPSPGSRAAIRISLTCYRARFVRRSCCPCCDPVTASHRAALCWSRWRLLVVSPPERPGCRTE